MTHRTIRTPLSFNSRLREEATYPRQSLLFIATVSTHASVRRRQLHRLRDLAKVGFQLTPP